MMSKSEPFGGQKQEQVLESMSVGWCTQEE